MLPPIFQYLSGAAAVTAIVGNGIYGSGIAPQDAARPYVVWCQVGIDSLIYFDKPQDTDYDRVQVHCFSDDEAQAKALAAACRGALDSYGYIVGGVIHDFDTDSRLYRVGFDFGFWDNRDGTTSGAVAFLPYAGDALTLPFGEPLTGPIAVAIRGGEVFAADANEPDEVTGILINSGATGQTARVVVNGTVTNNAWSWVPGQVFYADGGALTQTAPSGMWVQEVARSINASVILVQVKTPVLQ